jgi:hypothetical protein
MTYRTFKRSCRNWREFASARKFTDRTGLTYEEARQRCEDLNKELTRAQQKKGTKYEFEREE